MQRRGVLVLLGVVVLGAGAAVVGERSGWFAPMSGGVDRATGEADSSTGPASENEGSPEDPDASPATATLAARPRAKTAPPREHDDRITGRVVNASGEPIADARVLDVPATVTEGFDFDDVGREGFAVSDAVADGDGRFTVAARGDSPLHTIVARAWHAPLQQTLTK